MTESVEGWSLAHSVVFDAQEGRMRCMPHTVHLSALEVSLPTKHMVSHLCKHNNSYLRELASSNVIRRSRSITKIQLWLLWTKALMTMLLDRMTKKKRKKTPLKCYWVFCQQSKRSGFFCGNVQYYTKKWNQASWQKLPYLWSTWNKHRTRLCQWSFLMSKLNSLQHIQCFISKVLFYHYSRLISTSGHALDYEEVIENFVAKNKELCTFELSPTDWDAITLVTKWLKSFRSATTQMSAAKTSMLSSTYAIFVVSRRTSVTHSLNFPIVHLQFWSHL